MNTLPRGINSVTSTLLCLHSTWKKVKIAQNCRRLTAVDSVEPIVRAVRLVHWSSLREAASLFLMHINDIIINVIYIYEDRAVYSVLGYVETSVGI